MIDLFQQAGIPLVWANTLGALIAGVILVSFVVLPAIFFIWLERKLAGRLQDRLGPTRVGGKFGWLQTFADGIKLLTKEDLIPDSSDPILFRLGPYLAFAGVILSLLILPFAEGWVAYPLSISLFFMLAVLSTEIFGILLAGFGSGSKWALFGAIRQAAQVVSYEIPMILSVLVPVIVSGSIDFTRMAQQQSGPISTWLLFTLAGISGIFFLLGADFIGSCQLLVYVGGTMVLLIFGVMLTAQGPMFNLRITAPEWFIAITVGFVLLFVLTLCLLIVPTDRNSHLNMKSPSPLVPVTQLGEALLGFEEANSPGYLGGTGSVVRQKIAVSYLLPFVVIPRSW